MASLLNKVLNAMEQVVLEIVDTHLGSAKLVEGDTEWAKELFPNSYNQQLFTIDDEIPFLHDFLIDARVVWHGSDNGRVRSGFWTEITISKQELHLEAIAIKHGNYNLLVIANQREEFTCQQHTKQLARELLLSNERLYSQNEYLHTRLLSIFQQPHQAANILTTLTKVIEKAEFAVLIADGNLNAIIENSATLTLFEQDQPNTSTNSAPLEIIIQLLKNQIPEYERIVLTKSYWQGELCWMSPPSTLKWLKISLHPVKNHLNEVENWIIFANDISTVKYLTQRNEQLAFKDMLTELPNRFSFWQTLEKQITSSQPFYLLYIDINDFRRHNEFYGHDEGDKLLIEFGKRIQNVIKESDYIARVGGDEFAIILTNMKMQSSCEIALQRILEQIKKPFHSSKLESFNVSVSIGAASFPNDAQSAQELMKFVDLSAYNGKNKKKNSLQFYSTSMQEASHHLFKIERELRDAIKNNEFELFLQPIVDLKNNNIYKAEALIRWNHPTRGMVSPDNFIPIAEQTGLINAIGEWVIKETCLIAGKLKKLGYKIKLSMNLSPSQVTDAKLFSCFQKSVTQYDIDPSLLEIEVTEGVLVDDYSVAEKLLSKVRTLGSSVSVDDFGTGYSSLAYLKKLPLDFLKIDRSFIKDIVVDDNDKAIVRAVIAMAHSLNLRVIAEGVEVKEQLNFLVDNYCNSAQGYLFSRPIKYDDFVELLDSQL